MQDAPPRDEAARIAALTACAVLDTPRETAFDNIVFTMAQLFRAPMAMLALVDADRVWAKATAGPVEREWRRSNSFCSSIVQGNQLISVEDATSDARFSTLPTVTGPPLVRFIAGAPLRGPRNLPVGALCVMDRVPRSITERQRAQLSQLAAEASELLRQRVPNLDLDLAG